jgi:hypothetical protein
MVNDTEQEKHPDKAAQPHCDHDTGTQAETPTPEVVALMALTQEGSAARTRRHRRAILPKEGGQNLGR